MKWKLNRQDQTVSLTNLDIVRGEDDTPIAYIGDTSHSNIIMAAPEMKELLEYIRDDKECIDSHIQDLAINILKKINNAK